MKPFSEVWERARAIRGWLNEDEARLLFAFCSSPWCEIGSWHGRSTVILGNTGPGTAIDWFEGSQTGINRGDMNEDDVRSSYDECVKNTHGLPVTIIRKRFEDAVDDVGEIKFLFLDAEHTFQQTQLAFDLYSPKVSGFIAIHDSAEGGWTEVEDFVKTITLPEVCRARSLVVFAR